MREDIRIPMFDFDRGEGATPEQLYLALTRPPEDHRWGRAAAAVPYLRPYLPAVLRTGLGVSDFYFETLSGVKASIPPLPPVVGFFFAGIFMHIAESMWGEGAGLAIYATAVLLGIAGYLLGIGAHMSASRLYLSLRGEREAEFPEDYLEELDVFSDSSIHAPRLNAEYRHPKTPEAFKNFYEYHSRFLAWLIQERHFDALAKALKSLRKRFPYAPIYELIDRRLDPHSEALEDDMDFIGSGPESSKLKSVEVLNPADPVFERVQKIIKLRQNFYHSSRAHFEKKEAPKTSLGNNYMGTEHRAPEPRHFQISQMEPVYETPEFSEDATEEYFKIKRCDIYALPLLEGGEVELSHMPEQTITLAPYMRRTAHKPKVWAPDLDRNNMAILLAEFVGRQIRHAPLPWRENYSRTGLFDLCCRGNCFTVEKSSALRLDFQAALLRALLRENPFEANAPLRAVNPVFNRVAKGRKRASDYLSASAMPKNTLVLSGPLSLNDDRVPLDEKTHLLDKQARAQEEVFVLHEEPYRFQVEQSDLHRRALEIVALLRPASGRDVVHYHQWEFFRHCEEGQFKLFMKLTEEERARFIYILLSGYPNAQLLCLSFIQNQYTGKKSINPFRHMSEEDQLQLSYDARKVINFIESYIRICKTQGVNQKVLARHLYMLTALSDKRATKQMRSLFEEAPELAAEILSFLTYGETYDALYAAHVRHLFYGNKVAPAAQDRILSVLQKEGKQECKTKLLSSLEIEIRSQILAGLHFSDLPRLSNFIKHESKEVRERAYAIHAQRIGGISGQEAAWRLASQFKRRNSLRSFCDKGKLVELGDVFAQKLEAGEYNQAIPRLAWALLKKEWSRKEVGLQDVVKMKKVQLFFFIFEHFFQKTQAPVTDMVQVFFDMGIQLKLDEQWEGERRVFEEIFSACLSPKRLIKNEYWATKALLQGFIRRFQMCVNLKKQYRLALESGAEEGVNSQALKTYVDYQESVFRSLWETLVKTSFSKTGKDALGLIPSLTSVPFPRGLLMLAFRAVFDLSMQNESKYQIWAKLLEAHFKNKNYSDHMDCCAAWFEKASDDASFGDMWLFLAFTKLKSDEGKESLVIVKEMFGRYSSELPDNAVRYLMPIFCVSPDQCCEGDQRPLLLKFLFSLSQKTNYKPYAKSFGEAAQLFNNQKIFLPELLLPQAELKSSLEQKTLACRVAAMMLYSHYDKFFWGPNFIRRKRIPENEKITNNARDMYEIITRLFEALKQVDTLLEDFIKQTFEKAGIFKTIFEDMGFGGRSAENIGRLVLCYHHKVIAKEAFEILGRDFEDITLEENGFFEEETSAELIIEVDEPLSEEEVASKEKEELIDSVAQGSFFLGAPHGYQSLLSPEELELDEEEASTSLDEEEDSSWSNSPR